MNYKTHNFLVVLVCVLIIVVFVISMIIVLLNQKQDRMDVCKRIGVKSNLEYYDVGQGKCGWGEDCYYQCKFIDDDGEIVVKNVQ